jgi:hypothetical protein
MRCALRSEIASQRREKVRATDDPRAAYVQGLLQPFDKYFAHPQGTIWGTQATSTRDAEFLRKARR